MSAPPGNANARLQPGEHVTLTDLHPRVAPVSPGIKLISLIDGGAKQARANEARPRRKKSTGMKDGDTYGAAELCTRRVGPGTCRFQTPRPDFARKLSQLPQQRQKTLWPSARQLTPDYRHAKSEQRQICEIFLTSILQTDGTRLFRSPT
jgi:hypothetical protein